MITLRKAHERGGADYGWLKSKHSFSFANYYDPKHMGFSALRVINDDVVAPGAGFDTHGHRDMEIISYVLSGTIEHKDSAGNIKTLPAGEFQLMSAGKGIFHSEYNASNEEQLRFLQIWIEPNSFGGKPGYQQKDFGKEAGLTTIVTPNGENGTLAIKQDAKLYQLILEPKQQYLFEANNEPVYVHQVSGSTLVNATQIESGDGAKVLDETELVFENVSNTPATIIIFELPQV
ncbi:pirin family protein [Pseudoalteromonas sp. MMG024]|uniref:pirin family protein n=1 Tax=Pseudoalteromonas sp. MMG024 TaxID=2909980 RepID=UPI001F41304F|nr:pirin family protein [Pseudoalteromonas sp. MMG024]MCF6455244.1 pirin family protein [Pseudoalteromonas sp. MMG024]